MCDLPNNPIYIRCEGEEAHETTRRKKKAAEEAFGDFIRPSLKALHSSIILTMEQMIEAAELVPEDVETRHEDGGVYFDAGDRIQVIRGLT